MANNGKVTIRDVYEQVEKLRAEVNDGYVHKSEFAPIKSLVYGMVGLIMMAVATAIVSQVVRAFVWIIE